MGWSFTRAEHYKRNGSVDRKAEVDDLYTWESDQQKVSVVKSRMIGSDYYAAIKIEDHEKGKITVEAVMCLTAGKDPNYPWFNFGYKSIPHTDDDRCPLSIIKLLSPAEDEKETEWRKRCYEYSKKQKLSDLPVGSVIRYKTWDETEIILKKMAPAHQFKRTWWYKADTNTYMPSRRIPDNWELIIKGA